MEIKETEVFLENTEIRPPKGLFHRIIKRLGLEKELIAIKRHYCFFIGLAITFSILSVFAFIGLRQVLNESGLVHYLALLFSDTGMVFKNWRTYLYSILESIPAHMIFLSLIAIGLTLLFARFISLYYKKIYLAKKIINKQYYGHRK